MTAAKEKDPVRFRVVSGLRSHFAWLLGAGAALVLGAGSTRAAENTLAIGTYNVENYRLESNGARPAKSDPSRAKVRESIHAMAADVLALQEVGGREALEELRSTLRTEGLDYPHAEFVSGWDTNIQVAVLSRFPFTGRVAHTNESFLLRGRRFRVSRGFAEVALEPQPGYRLVLITAHLKSKRISSEADTDEIRDEEARLLRERVNALLAEQPNLNLVVLGDLNDHRDARSTKIIVGKGSAALIDTRPAERNGDSQQLIGARGSIRQVTWTHHFALEDAYTRIDYILVSRAMAREWMPALTHVVTVPNWGVGSDHRPIVARFVTRDR